MAKTKTVPFTESVVGKRLLKNHERYKAAGAQFQTTFGYPLSKFWDKLIGFDVCAFDEAIKTPDGTSTRDFIKGKWGEPAVKLVESLIGV